MAVKTVKESKVVHCNDHATVVIIDSSTRVVKVQRPEKNDISARDMEFASVVDLGEFLQGSIEVYEAACKTLGWTSGLTLGGE